MLILKVERNCDSTPLRGWIWRALLLWGYTSGGQGGKVLPSSQDPSWALGLPDDWGRTADFHYWTQLSTCDSSEGNFPPEESPWIQGLPSRSLSHGGSPLMQCVAPSSGSKSAWEPDYCECCRSSESSNLLMGLPHSRPVLGNACKRSSDVTSGSPQDFQQQVPAPVLVRVAGEWCRFCKIPW